MKNEITIDSKEPSHADFFLTFLKPGDSSSPVALEGAPCASQGSEVFIAAVRKTETEEGAEFSTAGPVQMADSSWGIVDYMSIKAREYGYLQRALRGVWTTLRYSQEYINYLIGNYDDEEFQEVAQKYVRAYRKADKEEIEESTAVIMSTLGGDLDSGQLSEMIDVAPREIDMALADSTILKKLR